MSNSELNLSVAKNDMNHVSRNYIYQSNCSQKSQVQTGNECEDLGFEKFIESIDDTIYKVKNSFKSYRECFVEKKFNMPTSNIVWLADWVTSECLHCGAKFSFFRRKHHCRLCGKIFCNKCSNKEINIEKKKKVRVCISCFALKVVNDQIIKNRSSSDLNNNSFAGLENSFSLACSSNTVHTI